jgi:hypothetical protein
LGFSFSFYSVLHSYNYDDGVFIRQHLPGFGKGDFVLPFEVEETSLADMMVQI